MRAASLSLVLLLAGCPANAPASTGAPISFADFPHEAARANCRLLFACCTPDEVAGVWRPGAMTEADCVTSYEMTFGSEHMAIQPYLDMGRVSWDAQAAGDCIAAIDAASCPDLFGPIDVLAGALVQPYRSSPSSIAACNAVLVGHVATGAQCYFDGECTSGFCPNDMLSPYMCTALPTAGQACTTRCAGDLYCDSRATDPRCIAPGADGDPCTPGSDGACMSGSCNSGVCGPRPTTFTRCGVTL